ncbi:CheW protein [Methanofollis liminatans DSM 4140]|uniref:CheW protein n=1 Tax=Methanofollis liminatans DSM 4140 TaxID=28892 RepID=J1AMG4_9EURY|nr:chemotaxis protein CheW [Methanofollis liminatans]EJG06003.1 CheW protein [Methanofollis liminatans DSM 4140]
MSTSVDVVDFEIGGTRYALDIVMAREIVEMVPLTPVPRAPEFIAGIINLRGEITNIINLNSLLQIPDQKAMAEKKIIVLVPEAAGGSNLGIIVDDVRSVLQVAEEDVEGMDESLCQEAYIKGIIREGAGEGGNTGSTGLIIWIDMAKMLQNLAGAGA